MTEENSRSDWRQALAEVAAPVGFVEAEHPECLQACGGSAWWVSNWAGLFVVRVDGLAHWEELQARLDEALSALEEAERLPLGTRDGYLVLLTDAAPDNDTRRTIELDTAVCRKQILWPECDGWRSALHRVVCLALPTLLEAAVVDPEGDSFEIDEWLSELTEMSVVDRKQALDARLAALENVG